LGSVVAIASTSAVLDQITYDPFGNVVTQTNATDAVRFGFAGMEFDSVTGLYYDHARYYDAAIGRFTTQDPKGFAAGDTNLYRYVGNDPTDASDVSGLDELPKNPFAPAPVGITTLMRTEPGGRNRLTYYPIIVVTPGPIAAPGADPIWLVTITVAQGGAPPLKVPIGSIKPSPDKGKVIVQGGGTILQNRLPVTVTTTVVVIQGPLVGGWPVETTVTNTTVIGPQ
jgi:RHS repeat-associated protein